MHTKQYPNQPISTAIDYVRRWAAANGDRVVSFKRLPNHWEPNKILFSDGSVMTVDYNHQWDETLQLHWWSVRWVDRNGTVIFKAIGYGHGDDIPLEEGDRLEGLTQLWAGEWVVKQLKVDPSGYYHIALINTHDDSRENWYGDDWRDEFEML